MNKRLWWFSKYCALLALLVWPIQTGAQSLWKEGASRSMVADKRAASVGDILTILVQENNSASKDQTPAHQKNPV